MSASVTTRLAAAQNVPRMMPGEVVLAIDVLGNPVRTEIVRQMRRKGHRSLRDLSDALGLSDETTYRHVQTLAAAGVIHRTAQSYRKTAYWHLNNDRFREVQNLWANYPYE